MLLVFSFLLIFPFFTYYVATTLFYRKVNSDSIGKTPPTVPYLIPGVFHAFSLAYEGPQKYFATLIKDYGRFAPFAVRSGLQAHFILRDPGHIEKAVQASKHATFSTAKIHVYEHMFGSPKTALNLYAGEGFAEQDRKAIEYAHTVLLQKHLTGTSLADLMDIYVSNLSRNLNDKMFQIKFWTQIEDFWSFFQQVVTRCTIETFFGSAILKEHPALLKEYWKYDDAVDGYVPGMSRLLMSTTYEGPRDQLLEGIRKWLKTNHSGSDFAKISEEDPIWDEHKGLKFVQERDDVIAKIEGIDLKARAAEILSVMYCSNSTTISSSFWALVEILGRPHLANQLVTEITEHYSSRSAEYDVAGIASIPLFQSMHKEIGRLHVANCLIKNIENGDCKLDKEWTLPQGTSIVAFSRDMAMGTEAWAKARSRTVEKPLDEFWPERFLLPNRTASSTQKHSQKKEKIETGIFSMEGLEHLDLAVAGDHLPRLGQDYVQGMQAATLAVFLAEFEVQLCDSEIVDAEETPPEQALAFGMAKMQSKLAVRIRKRTTNRMT